MMEWLPYILGGVISVMAAILFLLLWQPDG